MGETHSQKSESVIMSKMERYERAMEEMKVNCDSLNHKIQEISKIQIQGSDNSCVLSNTGDSRNRKQSLVINVLTEPP